LSEEECKIIYKKMDANNDGQINYEEFMKAICNFTGSLYKPFVGKEK
jgi:Ca2+-binding EF-hand superfamily protein